MKRLHWRHWQDEINQMGGGQFQVPHSLTNLSQEKQLKIQHRAQKSTEAS